MLRWNRYSEYLVVVGPMAPGHRDWMSVDRVEMSRLRYDTRQGLKYKLEVWLGIGPYTPVLC